MPTTNDQYIDDCQRTLSGEFHGDNIDRFYFNVASSQIIKRGLELDKLKKSLFYGKGFLFSGVEKGSLNLNEHFKHIDKNIVHGIIGKVTESIELLEALLQAALNETQIDLVNIKEEVGDGFWYDAILAKACGFTFEEAQQANIAKLKARYPEKFTSELAENRDLDAERKILEK